MIPVRDKTGGTVTGTVIGVALLVVTVILAFVIISTIGDANLLIGSDTKTITVTNETGAWINETTYTLTGFNSSWSTISITNTVNATDGDSGTIGSGNYTLTQSTGSWVNASVTVWTDVNVSYTYVYDFTTDEESVVSSLRYNFTDGIDEVSAKIPTILLIVAVVFLFGMLVLLIIQARRSGMIGSGGGGSL